MKKSISCWSFPEGTPLADCFRVAAAAGFDAIELALPCGRDELTASSSAADLRRIVSTAASAGLSVSSLASGLFWDYSLTAGDESIRERAFETAARMLELAAGLGVDTILVVPGAVDVFFKPGGEVVPYDLVYERAKSAVGRLVPLAEKHRVAIGLENVWNKFLLSPLEMKSFIDGFGSEFVGAYFDVGNVLPTGYPEQWIRILGRRIKKVHLKDYRLAAAGVSGFVDLLAGDVDWPAVIAALREVGYDDYLTAEMIPPYRHHPEALVHQTARAIDFILGRS